MGGQHHLGGLLVIAFAGEGRSHGNFPHFAHGAVLTPVVQNAQPHSLEGPSHGLLLVAGFLETDGRGRGDFRGAVHLVELALQSLYEAAFHCGFEQGGRGNDGAETVDGCSLIAFEQRKYLGKLG